MFRHLLTVLSLVALPLATTAYAAPEPIHQPGKVTAVTVYQGQALVTRLVELDSVDGLAEVVVSDLPARVTPGSLYAEPLGDVEIRSVRYRIRPVTEDTRAEVRELDEELQVLGDELAAIESQQELLKARAEYISKMETFTTKNANHELKDGVLNAKTLKELTDLVFEKREQIVEQSLELAQHKRELQAKLALLNRERRQLTVGSSKSLREAVVFINAPQAGPAKLRLTYLVSGASWSPSYNLRAADARDKVTIEYNASVQQVSGEDWTDVAMTLSTASPSLIAMAPSLDPLQIQLTAAQPPKPRSAQSYEKAKQELAVRQQSLSQSRRAFAAPQAAASGQMGEFGDLFGDSGANDPQAPMQQAAGMRGGEVESIATADGGLGGGGFGASYGGDFGKWVDRFDRDLNSYGCAVQIIDYNATTTSRGIANQQPSQGISVVYHLANRTSLPSRADQQLIPIASLPLKGEFYRVARPVLTEYVYEEAEVNNDSDVVLLAGPAATFLGDEFVGRGAVPTIAIGESFTIGLGIDESLRASRELVKNVRRLQGGNRIVDIDYRLTIENFGGQPTAVRLYDRLPKANDSEIKVSLLESTPEIANADSKQRKQGILEWTLEAPAKEDGAGRAVVDYSLQLEYDKNRSIMQSSGK